MAAASSEQGYLFGCPISGVVAPVSQCPDPTFSQGILGPGVVIEPQGCQLFAPCDSTVEFCLSTGHALGFSTPQGVKFLIHVGMDTNKLAGQGFHLLVQMGDQVRRGDPLLSFDPKVMEEHHCTMATPFVFCNCSEGWELEILKTGPTEPGEDIIRLTRCSSPSGEQT